MNEAWPRRAARVDLGQQLRVQESAMRGALEFVDAIALAERVEAVASRRMQPGEMKRPPGAARGDGGGDSRYSSASGRPRRTPRYESPRVPRDEVQERSTSRRSAACRRGTPSKAMHRFSTRRDVAPGLMNWWYARPVGRRFTSSMQPISMRRSPCSGSRPVVSVSSTISRLTAATRVLCREAGPQRQWRA